MSHALIWSSLNTSDLTTEDIKEIPFAGLGTNVAGTWNKKLYKLKWLNTSVNDIKLWLDNELADIYTGTPYPVIKKSENFKLLQDLGFDIRFVLLDSYNVQQLPDAVAATSNNLAISSGSELIAPLYVDGVLLAENQNILVKSQTTRSQNGLFKVKIKNPNSDLFLSNAEDIITASYFASNGSTSYYAYSNDLKPLQKANKGLYRIKWVDRTNTIQLQDVKAATTTNLSISGALLNLPSLSLDNFTLSLNDRVLVKDQTNSPENGIYYLSSLYTANSNTLVDTRSSTASTDDFWDTASEYIVSNNPLNVQVINGSTNGGKYYRYYTATTGSTTNLNWTEATHYYATDTALFYYEVGSGSSIGFSTTVGSGGTLFNTPNSILNFNSSSIGLTTADKILVKHYNNSYSGMYSVVDAGIGTNGIWSRHSSYDTSLEILPTLIRVTNNKNSLGGFSFYLNKAVTYSSTFLLNVDPISITDTFTPYTYEPVTNLITTEITNFSSVNSSRFANSGIGLSQRVLVSGQATTASQNGIYIVSSIGSSVNALSFKSDYLISRGSAATVATGGTFFLFAYGENSSAGSTEVKWANISSASLITCQAYTTLDKVSYIAEEDFDVPVVSGDRVVVNSSNKLVNGIYDVSIGSTTRGKFQFDSSFNNWMNKIYINILTNNTTTSNPGTYLSGDLMNQTTGSFQVVGTGNSVRGNVYVPEISLPPTTNYETYFTSQGLSSSLITDIDVDWYEQDFQKFNVRAVYHAPTTANFPTNSGTAISRLITTGTGNSLIFENDSVLVVIGTGLSYQNNTSGIYRATFVTSGSTGSSVYFSRHEDFKQTVYQSTSTNVKSIASPYERPIQINSSQFYFGAATAFTHATTYAQAYVNIRNNSSALGLIATTPDDSSHYNVGSEYYEDTSDIRLTIEKNFLANFPRIAPIQHYIFKGKTFLLTPTTVAVTQSDYKYPTYTFNDDVLKISFPNRLYTKFSATVYYYWEQGDRIVFEDNTITSPFNSDYYDKNGIYQIVYVQQVNNSYTYWCKRVKYAATNGHLDFAKKLLVKTGSDHTTGSFFVALPNILGTTYTWSEDNYDSNFVDCFVIDSSGNQFNYKPNVDVSINSRTGLFSPLTTLSAGTFYAYLYRVDLKLQIQNGYTASSSKVYFAHPENLDYTYCWDDKEFPNLKVFNNTSGSYTYYQEGVDFTVNAKEGYITPITSLITTGTTLLYLSSTPRYNQAPKSLLNRYYITEQVLTNRNVVKGTGTLNSSAYTADYTYIQKTKWNKTASDKNIRLTFDRKQRYNIYVNSNSYNSTVSRVLSSGNPNDYFHKKRLSQDGLIVKTDSTSEFIYTGYSSSGNSLGLYTGEFIIDKSTNNWVSGYNFAANENILIKHNNIGSNESITLPADLRTNYYNDLGRLISVNKAGKNDQKLYQYVSGYNSTVNLTYAASFPDPFIAVRARVSNIGGTNTYCLYFDPDSTNRSTSERNWINEANRTNYIAAVGSNANISNLDNVGSTINGYAIQKNDIVLIKDQTDKKQNGIYVVNTNNVYSLSRSTDLDNANELRALGRISYGSLNYEIILPNSTPYSIGSTALNTPIVIRQVRPSYTINANVSTTSNYTAGTLTTQFPDTIDSYSVVADDKVFLLGQTLTAEKYVGRFTKNLNAQLTRVNNTPGGVGDTSYFNIANYRVKDLNKNLTYELYFNPSFTGLGVSSIYWFRPDQSLTYSAVDFTSSTNIGIGNSVSIPGAVKGDRILLKDQTDTSGYGSTENGIYFIDENTTFILQRHELLDSSSEISVDKRVNVLGGINAGTYGLVYDETLVPAIDSTNLYWAGVNASPYLEDCTCATYVNVNLSSPPTSIDNIVLKKNDRILVKDQTILTQNGIYVVADLQLNLWQRANDLNSDSDIKPQLSVAVGLGTTNNGKIYRIKLPVPRDITSTQLTNYILDTDNIEWTEIDKNSAFLVDPALWNKVGVGITNSYNIGNAKMNTSLVATSKRFGIAVKTPLASTLAGIGISNNGNVRNLRFKVEYKTVED
jgi:hypothetical protein